ncbi:MAG TPA: GspH/FimT family pseudopilin [Thermoanaerobaculia bacterium]|nr:GspH/FimT family pseudopilin [Thermoanaerobaculia bacterium]
MISPPARSRIRGSGPLPCRAGFSAVELVAVLAMLAAATAVAAPGAMRLRAALSVRSGAAQTSAAFLRARAYAIARGRHVGIKFRKNGDRYEWALYVDGNGNGIRTADIESGVDRPLGIAFPWDRNDVMPGILKGSRVPDPGDPGQALDRLDDPIRFNSSDICSFSPMGESTPGSVYLWDGHDRMAVVRVFGRTAKVRALYYGRGDREWKQ